MTHFCDFLVCPGLALLEHLNALLLHARKVGANAST